MSIALTGLTSTGILYTTMSLLNRINAFLNEKKDRTTYQNADKEQRREMRDIAHRRRMDDVYRGQQRDYLKRGYQDTSGRYDRSLLVANAKDIRKAAPDMPMAHVYRAAKAGLHSGSDIRKFAEAGVPAKSIAGPLWKMHAGGRPADEVYPQGNDRVDKESWDKAREHLKFLQTPHVSPQDALNVRRHHPFADERWGASDSRPVSLRAVRETFNNNMIDHLNAAGVDDDDARPNRFHNSNEIYLSPALKKHLDKLPAEPSVADLRKAVKPHLEEVKQRTLVEAHGQLERGLPHFDEVALHPLKGLPAGYREATHEDAPALAKWCVKTNACLARSVSGEFGER